MITSQGLDLEREKFGAAGCSRVVDTLLVTFVEGFLAHIRVWHQFEEFAVNGGFR